jgi:hypothetical protein
MDLDARGFPVGNLRVSDADRDRALTELSEAFQVGRLTADEFDQRSGEVLAARTGKELTALLVDLPVVRAPADTGFADIGSANIVAAPPGNRVLSARYHPRFAFGASVAAACFSVVAVVGALNRGPSLQQREFFQEAMARQGVLVPLPPAQGFNWVGTITPGVIAVLLIVLIIASRVIRARRA